MGIGLAMVRATVDNSHVELWEICIGQCVHETVVSTFPWKVSVVGDKGPNYGRFDITNHRLAQGKGRPIQILQREAQ